MKKLIFLFIILSLSLTIYQLIIIRKERVALKQMIYLNEESKTKIDLLKNKLISSYKSEFVLSDSIMSENNQYLINDTILNLRPILFYRFLETSCSSCIMEQIKLVEELSKSKNIKCMLVSDYKDEDKIRVFKRTYGITAPIYICDKLLSTEAITPYFCILDKNGTICNLFFPDSIFPDLTEKYLKAIINDYFPVLNKEKE